MLKRHFTSVKEEPSSLAGTKGCTVRWLISREQGASRYAMRLFTLQPKGSIPLHKHDDTEHEIFVIQGQGIFDDGKEKMPVKQGDVLFIQTGDSHSFTNNTDQPLEFICVIPI